MAREAYRRTRSMCIVCISWFMSRTVVHHSTARRRLSCRTIQWVIVHDAPTRVQQASSDVCPEVIEKISTSNAHQSYSSSAQSCRNETQTNTRPVHSMFVAKNSLKPMSNLAISAWQAVRAKERPGGHWECEEKVRRRGTESTKEGHADRHGPTQRKTASIVTTRDTLHAR